MHPYKRSDRVGHLIQHEVSDIILNRVKDPRIGFVTITGVELTPDLRHARIFVSILRPEDRAPSMEAIESARGFIRQELGRRVKIRFLPEIEFRLDTTAEYGDHIERLLGKTREKP